MKKKVLAVVLAVTAVIAMSLSVYAYANYQVGYETIWIAAGSSYTGGLYINGPRTAAADTTISPQGLDYAFGVTVSANSEEGSAYDGDDDYRMLYTQLNVSATADGDISHATSSHWAHVVINGYEYPGAGIGFSWPEEN